MKDPKPSTRRMTYELTLPTVLTADQLAVLSRIGKSEMVEVSLRWFTALVTVYASCTGVSQTQAARALVRAAPVMKEIPAIPGFLEDPAARELLRSLIGVMDMNGLDAEKSVPDGCIAGDAQ